MYGSEQSKFERNSRRTRFALWLFGIPHMGARLRFWCNLKASKGLLETEKLEILDVGSQFGALAFWLARKYPGHRITGLEIVADMVQQCKIVKEKIGLGNVEFLQGDVEEPFSLPKKFNLVYSTHVLEHVEDDSSALRNIYDSMAIGGTLILQVPRKSSEAEGLSEQDHYMGHHRKYTEENLLSKMEEVGFQVVEVRQCYGSLGSYAYDLDRNLAAMNSPIHLHGILFPIALLLGYIDSMFTKNPQRGGLIAIGMRQ